MESRYNQFQILLKELDLYSINFPILLQNGFEDWESISALTPELLQEIGIIICLDAFIRRYF